MVNMRSIEEEMLKLFHPDHRRIVASFLMFTLIMAGRIQAYAFVDDVPGVEKPPLYDMLSPFDFWSPSMFLLLPIILAGSVAARVIPELSSLATGKTAFLALAAYIYMLSSLLFYSHDRWGRNRIPKKIFPILYAIFSIPLLPGFLYSLIQGDLELTVLILSSILVNGLVFTMYAYLGICLLKPSATIASRLKMMLSRYIFGRDESGVG